MYTPININKQQNQNTFRCSPIQELNPREQDKGPGTKTKDSSKKPTFGRSYEVNKPQVTFQRPVLTVLP